MHGENKAMDGGGEERFFKIGKAKQDGLKHEQWGIELKRKYPYDHADEDHKRQMVEKAKQVNSSIIQMSARTKELEAKLAKVKDRQSKDGQ